MDNPPVEESVSVPPYAAWSYFERFADRMCSEDVPARVDKKLLQAWGIAGGNESSLVSSLHALGMIDRQGRPTPDFRALRLSAPRRREALQRAFERAYPGLPYDLDPPISDDELHDYFVDERGLTGQMVQKAMRFYRRLAEAVRVPAPHEERPAPPPQPLPQDAARTAHPPDGWPPAARGAEPAAVAGSDAPEYGDSDAVGTGVERAGPAREVPVGLIRPPEFRTGEGAPSGPAETARPTLSVNLSVAISLDATDAELEALFRRVRRAWERVFEAEPPHP